MVYTIFEPKWDEVTEGWGKLYNEERHNLHSSPNITRVPKSRRMRWAWHMAYMGDKKCIQNFGSKA
jgi:hypothetical protein